MIISTLLRKAQTKTEMKTETKRATRIRKTRTAIKVSAAADDQAVEKAD